MDNGAFVGFVGGSSSEIEFLQLSADLDVVAATQRGLAAYVGDRVATLRSEVRDLGRLFACLPSSFSRSPSGRTGACAGCFFDGESWHDELLRLEDDVAVVERALGVVEIDWGIGFGDVALFIREHNWRQPSVMEGLAQRFEMLERMYFADLRRRASTPSGCSDPASIRPLFVLEGRDPFDDREA